METKRAELVESLRDFDWPNVGPMIVESLRSRSQVGLAGITTPHINKTPQLKLITSQGTNHLELIQESIQISLLQVQNVARDFYFVTSKPSEKEEPSEEEEPWSFHITGPQTHTLESRTIKNRVLDI